MQNQQQVRMQISRQLLTLFWPITRQFFSQLDLEYLAAGKQAQGMTAGLYLLPLWIIFQRKDVAFAKTIGRGDAANGIQ